MGRLGKTMLEIPQESITHVENGKIQADQFGIVRTENEILATARNGICLKNSIFEKRLLTRR